MIYDSPLDEANDAPLASDAERSGFWRWVLIAAALAAGCIALAVSAVHFVSQYNEHEKRVEAIQNPPSGSPEIGASPKNTGLGYGKSHIPNKTSKNATNNIANEALNTPAMPSFEGEKVPEFKQEKAEPETLDQLNARLEKLNQQLLKGSL